MPVTQYIGARYMPIFADPPEHSSARTYEPLTVVLHEGNSYTSKQFVPKGIQITNEAYWAETGNYNAQVESYRREVQQYVNAVSDVREDMTQLEARVDDSISDLTVDLNNRAFKRVDTYVEMKNTTEDIVIVNRDDGYYGSFEEVTFIKNPYEQDLVKGLEPRSNGDYMIPVPLDSDAPVSNAPAEEIGQVAQGYIGRETLQYGTTNNALTEVCRRNIDCSTFVQMVLWGIPYEFSRYNGYSNNCYGPIAGTNIPRNISGNYSVERKYGYRTSELAMYFAEKKRLFRIKHDRNAVGQLQIGDVLFESDLDGTVTPDADNTYFHVHHCMIVLQTFPNDGAVLVAQCGSAHSGVIYNAPSYDATTTVCRLTLINPNNRNYVIFARPDYGNPSNEVKAINILNDLNSYEPITLEQPSSSNIISYGTLAVKPELNKIYTLVVEGKLPTYDTDGCFLYASFNTPISSRTCFNMYRISNYRGRAYIYGTFQNNIPEEISGDARFYLVINSSAMSGEHTYQIDNAALYDGLVPNPYCNTIRLPNLVSGTEYMNIRSQSSFVKDGVLHIWASCSTTDNYNNVVIPIDSTILSLNKSYLGRLRAAKYSFMDGATEIVPVYVAVTGTKINNMKSITAPSSRIYFIDIEIQL